MCQFLGHPVVKYELLDKRKPTGWTRQMDTELTVNRAYKHKNRKYYIEKNCTQSTQNCIG